MELHTCDDDSMYRLHEILIRGGKVDKFQKLTETVSVELSMFSGCVACSPAHGLFADAH